MSTPARKSGRQAKPTEKFKEYLYEREVPTKIEHKASITEHIQSSKEKTSAVASISTTSKKRGRPRKSVLEVDPLKNKNNNPETEDDNKDNDTKDCKNKRGFHKEMSFKHQPESNSSTMTDSESEGEEHNRKIQESGLRRSGRPPKLNKRLLSYLHSDEVSKSANVQTNTVSIEGQEFKVVRSPDRLVKRNNQAFKTLPVPEKICDVYDFIPSPPKASRKGFDKENKKLMYIENEPRRSIRTPKTNARLLNFLNSEVTPKRQTSTSETRENSMNTNGSSNMCQATPKKANQKIFEDITSGEASSPEPRRSSRVPKMNERLLNYLNREEGTIISVLFSEKQTTVKGSAGLASDLNSSPRISTNGNNTNGSSCSDSIEHDSQEKKEKTVCDLEPRRSSREPKTSQKLYNYLHSAEGKYKKLSIKSPISSSILPQQPSFQRIHAEMKISPIGDLSPRRSSRAPKTNERLLNYLHSGDRKNKRTSEVTETDSQTSPITTTQKEKVNYSTSSSCTNGEKLSEEESPIKEPRRSSRTPKTNEKLRNYLKPKGDPEVASTSNGEPILSMLQNSPFNESPGSVSSFKNLSKNNSSPNEKKIMSDHKIKQCSIILTNIENEKKYRDRPCVKTSSLESLFKDEPLPIPYNAWLLCLGHHSSQFGYSTETETTAARVYIENQGVYLGTHQILLNEYKRQLKDYFSNLPKNLRSKYLELRANHIWNCFNEDIFEEIIGSSFTSENNMPIVESSKIDQVKVSRNKLPSESDSDNIKSYKTPRKRKKRKGNSVFRKCKKDIYRKTSLTESDSSLKEDDNESETSSNKDNDNINIGQCLSRHNTKRKLSNVFVQQTQKNSYHMMKGTQEIDKNNQEEKLTSRGTSIASVKRKSSTIEPSSKRFKKTNTRGGR